MHKMILAALLPLAACGNDDDGAGIPGMGTGNERSYAVTDFTEVGLAGSDDVEVRVGPAFSVRATGEPAALERLRIERKGDTLSIGRRGGFNWSGGGGKVRVAVTMPRIAAASLAGSGDMRIDRASGERFGGSIAGSGSLAIAELAVDSVKFEIAGSGDVAAAGRADALDIDIAGAGNIDAPRLAVRRAKVSIAGSGDVKATVDGEADVSIMGSGNVDFGPKARCRVDKAGSGTVRCGG